MQEVWKAAVYGIVEGITEWLPISSTGHLLLLEHWLPFSGVQEGFFALFDVVIQLGAICAVLLLYWPRLFPLALGRAAREEHGGGGAHGCAAHVGADTDILSAGRSHWPVV